MSEPGPESTRPPSFTIVVPTHDRPEQLARCLDAVTRLDYPSGQIEVVAVDDGSGADLTGVVGRFTDRLELSLMRQPRAGPAAARNRGARRARREVLAFTDDDCAPAPGWLAGLAAAVGSRLERAAGGLTVVHDGANAYAAASQEIVRIVYAYYNARPAQARFFAANNLAVSTQGFLDSGGFDERFTTAEDREFCDRWTRSGGRLEYAPDAVVVHAPTLDFPGFVRRHFEYGRGAYHFHRSRDGRVGSSVRRELGFYRRLPGLLPETFERSGLRGAPARAGLLAVWQVANAAGFGWEAARGRG